MLMTAWFKANTLRMERKQLTHIQENIKYLEIIHQYCFSAYNILVKQTDSSLSPWILYSRGRWTVNNKDSKYINIMRKPALLDQQICVITNRW